MKRFWEPRSGATSKLIIAAVFLCVAVAILAAFLSMPYHLSGNWGRAAGAGAIASPFIFFSACVIVFFRPRSGYTLGFVAGLIALPWLVWTELGANSWIALNFAGYGDLGGNQIVTFTKLKIVAALMVNNCHCELLPTPTSGPAVVKGSSSVPTDVACNCG